MGSTMGSTFVSEDGMATASTAEGIAAYERAKAASGMDELHGRIAFAKSRAEASAPLAKALRSKRAERAKGAAAVGGWGVFARRDPTDKDAALDDFAAVCPLEVGACRKVQADRSDWNRTALAGFMLSGKECGFDLMGTSAWFQGAPRTGAKIRFRGRDLDSSGDFAHGGGQLDGFDLGPADDGWRSLEAPGVADALQAVLASRGVAVTEEVALDAARRAALLLSRIASAEATLFRDAKAALVALMDAERRLSDKRERLGESEASLGSMRSSRAPVHPEAYYAETMRRDRLMDDVDGLAADVKAAEAAYRDARAAIGEESKAQLEEYRTMARAFLGAFTGTGTRTGAGR